MISNFAIPGLFGIFNIADIFIQWITQSISKKYSFDL